MSRRAILLIGELTHTEQQWKALSRKYILKVRETFQLLGPPANQVVQEYIDGSRKDFLKKLRDGDFDDVVGLYRSNMSVAVRLSNVTLREAG